MSKSAPPSPPLSDAVAPTLHRPPGQATPVSDELATTLHPSQKTPSQGGVDPSSHGWNLSPVSKERYLLEGVVAEGGHGRILRAKDLHLERWVALKEPISWGSSTQVRFLREARITARLQHPAIVPVYEAGRFPGGEPFYAMKLVSGRSLAHLIDSMGPLGERLSALPHVLAVADAMAYAHSQRVIHRDFKPSNILVGEFAETVVIDWGLAKELGTPDMPGDEASSRAGSPEPEHTQLGTVMGTPAYMPPSRPRASPWMSAPMSYALGAILYHLLSGRRPTPGPPRRRCSSTCSPKSLCPSRASSPGSPRSCWTSSPAPWRASPRGATPPPASWPRTCAASRRASTCAPTATRPGREDGAPGAPAPRGLRGGLGAPGGHGPKARSTTAASSWREIGPSRSETAPSNGRQRPPSAPTRSCC